MLDLSKMKIDNNKRHGAERLEIEWETHPLAFLERMAVRYTNIVGFTLITYDPYDGKYDDTTSDKEHIFILAREIAAKGLEVLAKAFDDELDVTLSSVVLTTEGEMHMQLIDCLLPTEAILSKQYLGSGFYKHFEEKTGTSLENFELYYSGRSYHAYGPELMTLDGWRDFNARLLTLPDVEVDEYKGPLEDFRWIGYRLFTGFSALRLSAVDKHYLQVPRSTLAVKAASDVQIADSDLPF